MWTLPKHFSVKSSAQLGHSNLSSFNSACKDLRVCNVRDMFCTDAIPYSVAIDVVVSPATLRYRRNRSVVLEMLMELITE
jgi:hypothetical protein